MQRLTCFFVGVSRQQGNTLSMSELHSLAQQRLPLQISTISTRNDATGLVRA